MMIASNEDHGKERPTQMNPNDTLTIYFHVDYNVNIILALLAHVAKFEKRFC